LALAEAADVLITLILTYSVHKISLTQAAARVKGP
jgi:hypothetical protein